MLIVTYGIYGGNVASDSLNGTLELKKLDVVETRTQLEYPGRTEGEHGMFTPTLQKAMVGSWMGRR